MAGINKNNGYIKIRDLYPQIFCRGNEYEEYLNLALNSISIKPTDPNFKFGYVEEDFIKKQLVTVNCVGYDGIAKMFAIVYAYGYTDYWKPYEATFSYPNGRNYTRKLSYEPNKSGAFFIRGLPADISLSEIIRWSTDKIAKGEEVIIQNLGAVKTPFIVQVKDKDTKLSVKAAIEEREAGKPVIIVDSNLTDALKGITTYTEFIAPAVDELNDKERDRLLNKLGTMTANTNKRERVQSSEVSAGVGKCEDYVYILIDNVNKQFETYGIPLKMELNNSLEELYTEGEETDLTENIITQELL